MANTAIGQTAGTAQPRRVANGAGSKVSEVVRLSKMGKTTQEMADALGTTRDNISALRSYAKKKGHDIKPLCKHLTPEEHAKVADMRRAGATQAQIADALGRSMDGVRRSLQLAGLLSAPQQAARPLEVRRGSIGKALSVADDAAFDWIMSQVPVGGNIAETLVEIALDQYFEKGATA